MGAWKIAVPALGPGFGEPQAGRAYSRLDDKNRTLVHAVCQKNGIAVGD